MEVETLTAHHHQHFSSDIGPISAPKPHGNSLEDDFASKINLLPRGGWENIDEDYDEDIEVREENEDDSFDDPSDMSKARCLLEYNRFVVEDGIEVEKPANRWHVYVKDGPPEGSDEVAYHLDILKQVVGSDAWEVYNALMSVTEFATILTDEEHDKLSGLKEVVKTLKLEDWICYY